MNKPRYWGSHTYEYVVNIFHTEQEAKADAWMNTEYFPLYSKDQLDVLVDALKEIANEDYRGNRSSGSVKAYMVLKKLGYME
jgi:hypothetical protein